MKLSDDRYKLAGTAKRLHYLPQAASPYFIEGLGQVKRRSQRSRYAALGIFPGAGLQQNYITLVVPRSERKPHWIYGRRPCSRCWMRRLSRIPANILSAR